MEPIKIGNYNISYLGSNFQGWFGGMSVEKGKKLENKKLSRSMNNAEIMAELRPDPVTLGDMLATLEKMDHGTWAIFYIKDKNGVLRAVNVLWSDGGWHVFTDSVKDTGRWGVGDRVFSRNFGVSSTPETPRPSDTLSCPHCGKALQVEIK